MNWSRIAGVVIGATIWMVFDAIFGKAHDPGMALLAGFATAWMSEKSCR